MSSDDINIDYYYYNNSKSLKSNKHNRHLSHYHSQRRSFQSSSLFQQQQQQQQQQKTTAIIAQQKQQALLKLDKTTSATLTALPNSKSDQQTTQQQQKLLTAAAAQPSSAAATSVKNSAKPTTLLLTNTLGRHRKLSSTLSEKNFPRYIVHQQFDYDLNQDETVSPATTTAAALIAAAATFRRKHNSSSSTSSNSNNCSNNVHTLLNAGTSSRHNSSGKNNSTNNFNHFNSNNSSSNNIVNNKIRRSVSNNSCGISEQLYHSTSNIYAKGGTSSKMASPSRYSPHQPEGFHHIGGRLSIHPIDRYDDSITCCSLPPPSPAPTSDRFIMGGIPAPASSSSISSAGSLSIGSGNSGNSSSNHHHHHHHYSDQQSQIGGGSITSSRNNGNDSTNSNLNKYATMHRTMSPSSRYRISSSERYHRDLSPKCTPPPSQQQQQQQQQQQTGSQQHQPSQTNSDRYVTTTTHFLTNSTPLVSSDAYAYLSSTVHTPVKRYVPTPPPQTEIYSDIPPPQSSGNGVIGGHQSPLSLPQHQSQQHVSTLPYRFRMKCCLTDPTQQQQQQQQQIASVSCQSNRMNNERNNAANMTVTDHYATPPRVRPLKCSSTGTSTVQQQSNNSSNTSSISSCNGTGSNCNSGNVMHGRQSRTASVTSQCIMNDYLQRTPSSEYLGGNNQQNPGNSNSRGVVTPVSVMSEPITNSTCLHCNTMRRTTGVHQTTQTTGPISPVPQQQPSQLPLPQQQQNFTGLNSNNSSSIINNHSESVGLLGDCISISPTPSNNNQTQLSPLSPKQQQQQQQQQHQQQQTSSQQQTEQQILCRSAQQQQTQLNQQQQQQQQNLIPSHSSLIRNVQQQNTQTGLAQNQQQQQQQQSTVSSVAVPLGPSQQTQLNSNLNNQNVRQQQQQQQQMSNSSQQHHHLIASSNNLQNQMVGNIAIGSANNLLSNSSTTTPQRNTLTIRQQMQQRFSRKQRLKEYIRREIAQFFGVDAQSEDDDRYKWSERQKRLALRRLGPLKSDLEMSSNGGNFGDGRRDQSAGDRPDILPAQITAEESQISNFDNDLHLRLPIEKKASVPTMCMSGILYIIQTLNKRQPRQQKQWSRSFAPSHVTALNGDNPGDICEGLTTLQEEEVFFDSPGNDVGAGSSNGNSGNGRSNAKIIEHSRQIYMGERVHGWRTSAVIDQQHIQQQPGGGINGRSSVNGGQQQPRLGYRGTRISSQILDGVLENSRRPIARKVKMFHPNELDDRNDHRPFFTYWINTVQILVLILSLICYGIGPIGLGIEQKTGQVLVTSLSLQTVQHQEQRNLWIGPRNNDLVHLGAKFAACMRRDVKIMEVISKTRRQERETACCIRNDDSGCVQSSQADCSVRGLWPTKSISTWKKWSPDESGPGGRISGSVCGLDPKYCDAPASIAPYEWPDDITKWPICRKTNSFSQRFRFKGHTAEHMVCEVIGHPCCTGVFGECRITTREYCDFVNGYFHEEASLCSQVSCLNNVCGMFPFLSVEIPDQFYRLFTSLCLHAGIIHLAITIAFQHVFLADLERLIGPIRTAIVYIGSGLAGNLTSAILVPYKPEVGPLASLAGVISSLVVLLLLAHWRQLKKPHLALMKLIVIGGTLFGMGTLPWQQNFAGLIAGIFCGVYLTIALVPFVSITKYGRKAKINLIWTCVLFHLFIYSIMFVIFYVFPTELTSINLGDIINGNGFNTHSTTNHKNRFDIDNFGTNIPINQQHHNHHHHTDVIDDRGGDDRVMSAGTVNEMQSKMNLNLMQTYNAAVISNFHQDFQNIMMNNNINNIINNNNNNILNNINIKNKNLYRNELKNDIKRGDNDRSTGISNSDSISSSSSSNIGISNSKININSNNNRNSNVQQQQYHHDNGGNDVGDGGNSNDGDILNDRTDTVYDSGIKNLNNNNNINNNLNKLKITNYNRNLDKNHGVGDILIKKSNKNLIIDKNININNNDDCINNDGCTAAVLIKDIELKTIHNNHEQLLDDDDFDNGYGSSDSITDMIIGGDIEDDNAIVSSTILHNGDLINTNTNQNHINLNKLNSIIENNNNINNNINNNQNRKTSNNEDIINMINNNNKKHDDNIIRKGRDNRNINANNNNIISNNSKNKHTNNDQDISIFVNKNLNNVKIINNININNNNDNAKINNRLGINNNAINRHNTMA